MPSWTAQEAWAEDGFGFIYESLARFLDMDQVGHVLPVFVSYPDNTPLITKRKEISEFLAFCSGCDGWNEHLASMVAPLKGIPSRISHRVELTLEGTEFLLDWIPSRDGYEVCASVEPVAVESVVAALGDAGAIGIIPDGGRRWARAKGISLGSAYSKSAHKIARFVEGHRSDVHTVAIYWMSEYNLRRSQEELSDVHSAVLEMSDQLASYEIPCWFVGALDHLPTSMFLALKRVNMESRQPMPGKPFVIVCMAYSASWERDLIRGKVRPWEYGLGPEVVERFEGLRLSMLVRSGGAHTLSEFLAFASSYASIHFLDEPFNDVDLETWLATAAAARSKVVFGA